MAELEVAISTVVLSWNRAELLQRTLASLAATTSVPHELIIVDNASTDGAREVARDFATNRPNVRVIELADNEGGQALNYGIEAASGLLVHLSENDLEYLAGWDTYALKSFEVFPDLGQLSVFGPVPSDDEAWDVKPCSLRHYYGHVLYEAAGNVGTSSVLRGNLFAEGVRVANLDHGTFKFPDDVKLSTDVKAAGFFVAWADHYKVRNVGHHGEEIEAHRDYYDANYRSKPWLGTDGLDKRLNDWRSRSHPERSSTLFPSEAISPEKTLPTGECPEPQLWSMIDGWTAELETLDAIHSLVRLIKPRYVVETGTWLGAGAVAIGKALQRNGRGRLTTIELDLGSFTFAEEKIRMAGVPDVVELLNGSSLEWTPREEIDMLFLDSATHIRGAEFERFMPYMRPGCFVIFHDTAGHHQVVGEAVRNLIERGLLDAFFLNTPRGIALGTYAGMGRGKKADASTTSLKKTLRFLRDRGKPNHR